MRECEKEREGRKRTRGKEPGRCDSAVRQNGTQSPPPPLRGTPDGSDLRPGRARAVPVRSLVGGTRGGRNAGKNVVRVPPRAHGATLKRITIIII